VEYQREGFIMFQAMMEAIREESVGFLFNLEVEVTPPEDVVIADAAGQHTEHHEPQIHASGLEAPEKPAQLQYTAPGEDGTAETRIEARNTGRSGNPAKAAVQDTTTRRSAKKKRR
jgi:preprotein translocase subunit SecA